MLLILFVLLLALVIWVTLKPTWLPKPPENQVTESISKNANKASESAKSISGTVVDKSSSWLGSIKVPFTKPVNLGKQLKTWASQLTAEHAELSAWLSGFSDEAAGQLSNDLSSFCNNQNLELAWLFDEKTDPELRSGLQDLVLFYCQAILKAVSAKPLADFQRWQAAPMQPENRVLTQKLYKSLVAANMASAPSDLLLASEKERESHVIQSIQSALAENRAAVLAIVFELSAYQEPSKTAEPEEVPAQKKGKKSTAAETQAAAEVL